MRCGPDIVSAALAFLLNTSAYYGEIFRAGIESVGRGQTEVARSTGLSGSQTMACVILPQAVRNLLPDLVSNTLEVAKLTSLASVVALPELLYSADMVRSITFNASPIVLAAAFYLVLLWPLVRLASRLEHRAIASRYRRAATSGTTLARRAGSPSRTWRARSARGRAG